MPPPAPRGKVPAEKGLCENFAPAMKNMVAMRWLSATFLKWLNNSHVLMIGR